MDYKTQNRIFLILERLWLFSAIIGALLAAYFIIQKDNDSALFFLGFFILSSLFYLLRKRQRVRAHKQHTLNGDKNGETGITK